MRASGVPLRAMSAARSVVPRTVSWSRRLRRRPPRTPRPRSPRRATPSTTVPGRGRPERERAELLRRAADLIERDRKSFAHAESLDTGKRLVESEYDVDDVLACLRYYAGIGGTDAGRVVDTGRPDAISRLVYEPVGVCGLITPWNYPLLQAVWKVAPALLAGNTFVLKPSELTPSTAIAADAGAGRGGAARRVWPTWSSGPGPAAGAPLSDHPGRRPGLVHRRAGHRAAGSWRRPRRR